MAGRHVRSKTERTPPARKPPSPIVTDAVRVTPSWSGMSVSGSGSFAADLLPACRPDQFIEAEACCTSTGAASFVFHRGRDLTWTVRAANGSHVCRFWAAEGCGLSVSVTGNGLQSVDLLFRIHTR